MFAFAPAIPSRSDLDWCWYLRRQGKAGELAERALHNIGVMDPAGWANWAPSTLNDTGAPVAMTFAQGQTALKMTTEIGDPAADPTNRVSDVCALMAGFGAHMPSAALRDVISAAQSASKLRYGARLGLETNGTQTHAILYAELPSAAADLSGLMSRQPAISHVLENLGDQVKPTMLRFHGTTQEVTIYWVATDADRTILPILTAPAQVTPDALSLTIDAMIDAPPQLTLPTRKLGFSYTANGKDTAPELSLYFSARYLFGSDESVKKHIFENGGNKIAAYGHMMDILNPAPVGQTHHGLIGMKAQQDAPPVLSITVAAPCHCPLETSSASVSRFNQVIQEMPEPV